MLETILRTGFDQLSLPLEDSALDRFQRYYHILEERSQVMNLTAIHGEADVARLHFLDCAALLGLADFAGRQVIDVGSGAGFPGLVLKIACPSLSLTMLDSLEKRVRFLEELCHALALEDVCCLHARAEEAPREMRQSYDIAVSRAVARLDLLAELCLPFVKKGGLFLAMKGPAAEEELRNARRGIALLGGQVEKVAEYPVPGTDLTHRAVIIRKVGETPAKYPRRWAQMKKQPL